MSNDRPDYRGNPLDLVETLADVAGGLGNWIANGTPDPDSIPGEIQQRYREHCDAWSNNPTWVQQIDPGARLFLSNACKPWLDSQGSGDPVMVTPTEPDFTEVGGFYDFRPYGGVLILLSPPSSGGRNVLDYTVLEFIGTGVYRVEYTRCDGSKFIETWNFDVLEIRSGGRCFSTGVPFDPDDFIPGPTPGPNPNPRPDPGLDPEDEPFERIPGQPLLPMPRITDPFGDPVQLPNFPLPNIEGPSLFPGDEPASDPESDPGQPGDPVDIPGGGEAEDTAPEGQELVGVRVEFTTVPGKPRQPSNVIGPQLYIGGAYVFMGIDGQGMQLQGEGSLIESGQFFFAARPSDKWRVIAALGYAVKVTPYYREVEA